MRCTIPGTNLKVVAHAVHALARIGEDLYFEPNVDFLSLRSVNAGRSAYASFTFFHTFFSFYSYTPPSDESEGSSRCRISMKSCLPVFRSPVNLDRKVENCLVRVEDSGSKLVFEMRFYHGIVKTYFLPVIESRILQVVYTKTPEMDCLNASVQVFTESFHNFSNSQEEITFHVSPDSLFIRSYSDASSQCSKMKSTEISLSISEFNKYCVKKESSMTFSHKEFRALLSFAEATNSDIEAYFGMKGKPVYFTLKHERLYEADFILSTVYPEDASPSMTPQQLRVQNSHSNPLISGGSSAVVRGNPPPSRTKSNPTPTPPSANFPVEEAMPDFILNDPEEQLQASVRRGESPSLMSVHTRVQTGTSRQTNMEASGRENLAGDGGSEHMDSQGLLTMSDISSVSLRLRESDNESLTFPGPVVKLRRMFSSPLDVNTIPGHNVILVNDSDEEAR